MIKNIFSRVMWIGRATVFAVGFTVTLALMLGIATAALAAVPGDPFKLGKINTIDGLSTLIGSTSTPMLRIDNNGGGTALDLQVQPGKAPMRVNAEAGKATNLNADRLDGQDSSALLGRNAVIAAVVNSGTGTVEATSNSGTTATKITTGAYRITFPPSAPNIGTCAVTATVEENDAPKFATVEGIDVTSNTVGIKIYGADGAPADSDFFDVVARCGLSAPDTAKMSAPDTTTRGR
jgi:hypothetical protein